MNIGCFNKCLINNIINRKTFIIIFILLSIKVSSQTNYSALYTSSNFVKTIDLTRPVGTVAGESGTTPTGGVTYTFPIFTPPGTNSLEPSVSISYNSQAGPGLIGFGWSISGLSSITRAGKNMYHNGVVKPVAYTSDDAFLLDGMRLNPVIGANGANLTEYRGEMETFSIIISNTSGSSNNPDWFLVTAKDGSKMEFGHTIDSRILTDDGLNVMMWRLNRIIDINGNYIDFKYDNINRDSRIDEINYTGNINTGLSTYNKLKFNYGSRYENNTGWDAGASMTSQYLLNNIVITHINDQSVTEQIKKYQFNYGFDNIHSLLKEVEEYGEGNPGPALNSTIFLYGDLPQNTSVYNSSYLGTQGKDSYAGDFNADGISDALVANYTVDPNGVKYHTSYTIYTDINIGFPTPLYPTYTLPTGAILGGTSEKLFNFYASDFDKDGRDDVLFFAGDIIESGQSFYLNQVVINKTKPSDPNGYQTVYNPIPTGYNWTNTAEKFFTKGDFDGDGNEDYILISYARCSSVPCSYKAYFSSPATNEINLEIASFGVGTNNNPDFYAKTIAEAKQIVPIDFNGDGKMELFVIRNEGSYVVSIDRMAPSTGFSFGATTLQTNQNVVQNAIVYPGDFNGDRKTDLLFHNVYNLWGILYSTGTSFVAQSFTFNHFVDGNYNEVFDKIMVGDFNGDGKSDIIHGYNNTFQTSLLCTYYSKGVIGGSLQYYYQEYQHNKIIPLSASTAIIGDYNGDGLQDFIYRYPTESDFIKIKPFGKERLLQKVTDGHNNTTSFNYKLMTDKLISPFVYERTVSLDDPSNQNPYNYVQLPVYLISSVAQPDGIGGTQTSSFYYQDAVVHRYAKGLLGFKKITTSNAVMGVTSVVENEINTQWAIPYTVTESAIQNSTSLIRKKSIFTNSFINLSTGSQDIRFFQKLDKTVFHDLLNGQSSEITNTYDNYGNITVSVIKKGEPSGTTVIPTETLTTTTAYGIHNTPVPAKPDNITISNTRSGMPALASTTSFTYHSNGNLATEISFSGLPKAVTSAYTYNSFGNRIQTIVSATGVTSKTITGSFDIKGRFAETNTISSGGFSETTSATWNTKWGKPSSETTADCRTSYSNYDAFGRTYSTTFSWLPYQVTYPLAWNINGQNLFISYQMYSAGNASSWVYHDKFGRKLKSVSEGFNGRELTKETTYDSRGREATSTNVFYPYLPNQPYEAPLITTITYDDLNRPISVANSLNTLSTTYLNLPGAQIQVSVQNSAGQTEIKVADAAGKTVSSTDNGGTMQFTYDSHGNQVEIKHGSTVLITNVFDAYGRQTSISDKDAGITTYDYDAFGQLLSQTDANNNTTSIVYDGLGKITSRTGAEGTTIYEYYQAGTCSVNKLWKVTGFSGDIKEFTYDAIHTNLPASEKATIDGLSYTTQYTYNSFGDLSQTTYPGSVVVQNYYDSKGYLLNVYGGTTSSPVLLYTINQMNSHGQSTSVTNGSGASSANEFYYGIPTRRYSQWIQDQNYTWNYTRLNLLSRNDAIKGITETFQYDNLDRLISTSVNSITQLSLSYDGNSSFSMGNITSKTDAGNYVYYNGANGINKIHAVAYITNPAGSTAPPVSHPVGFQDLAYTPFRKTESISENGVVSKDFVYGSDYERIKMRSWAGMLFQGTKYYFGDYEIIAPPGAGNSKIIYYVPMADGNVIIMEKTGIYPKYIATPLLTRYCYTDYLGSFLTITDDQSNIIAEQNFDAWGRYRNPNTWQFQTGGYTPPAEFYSRGFTGHEHLPTHYLINMNGRMYDPIMGRMLSPDVNISDAWNTRSYNRYSYANNNPLSFVDPDGNIIWFAVGVAALIGGITNGEAYQNSGRGFLGGFWRGAAASALPAIFSGGLSQAMPGLVGSIISGALGNMFGGGLRAGLMGGDGFTGMMQGLLTGGISGGLGAYFGGGTGALIGGGVSGGISSLMNGENVLTGMALGGGISFAMYHIVNFYNYSRSSLNYIPQFTYSKFARISGDYQRSQARRKEFSGILFADGSMYRSRDRHNNASRIPSEVYRDKDVIFHYHTHWDKAGRRIITNKPGDYLTREYVLRHPAPPGTYMSGVTTDLPSMYDIQGVGRDFPMSILISRTTFYNYFCNEDRQYWIRSMPSYNFTRSNIFSIIK